MFNSPFDSFHKTATAAKKEREQLDQLLTVSTPRERLLLAIIGLFLLVLAAWICFFAVVRGVTEEGVLVEFDRNLTVEISSEVMLNVGNSRSMLPYSRSVFLLVRFPDAVAFLENG